MSDKDLIASIRGVVKDEVTTALSPIITRLDGITDQLTEVSEGVNTALEPVMEKLDGITDQLSEVSEGVNTSLEPVMEKLDGITDQLTEVSEDVSELKDQGASYQKRLSKIEDRIGL